MNKSTKTASVGLHLLGHLIVVGILLGGAYTASRACDTEASNGCVINMDFESMGSDKNKTEPKTVLGAVYTIKQLRDCIANGGTRVCDLKREVA